MNNIFQCSNHSLTTFYLSDTEKRNQTLCEEIAQLLLLLSFPKWDFTLSCSTLNENKSLTSHNILMWKNTYVNRQEETRSLLDFHAKKH